MDFVQVSNVRIAFRQQGSGPPLVLLHGGLSDSRSWGPQLEGLSDRYTVTAWNTPGCGQSDAPPSEDIRLAGYADYLAGFLEEVGIKHPHILGLSFGGGLALQFYQQYSHIPQTLILASAYAGWAGSLPKKEVQERIEKGLEQSERSPEQAVKAWLPTLFTDSAPEEVVEETADILSDFHPVGMRAMLQAFSKADLRPMLSTISIPTLLLYGEEDQRSPIKTVALPMQKEIHGAILSTLPGVGHLGNVVAPELFNTEVVNFLKTNNS